MYNLNQFDLKGMWYLASPYSKYPKGLDAAFEDVARCAGALLDVGIAVFCPIVHGHHVARHMQPMDCADDHERWMALDRVYLAKCDGLIVAMLDGWEKSKGVQEEIALTRWRKKPVYFLDPETLELELENLE